MQDLIQSFDLFCVTESKLDKTDQICLSNYNFLSKPRKQTYIRKSGGIGLFVKNDIADFVSVVEQECEYILWVTVSKDILYLEHDLILGVMYVPPDCSRFLDVDIYEIMESEITTMCGRSDYVLLTGDVNAHTSNMPDYIHGDAFLEQLFDLDNETVEHNNQVDMLKSLQIPIDRISSDKKKDQAGFKLLDICKNNSLFICNGRLGSDKNIGKSTFRNKSVIDYSISSAQLIKHINDFEITELDSLYSDGHCLLTTVIKIKQPSLTETINSEPGASSNRKPYWNEHKREVFVANLDNTLINELQTKLTCNEYDESKTINSDSTVVNETATILSALFAKAADKTFNSKTFPVNYNKQNDKQIKPKSWFGPQCRNARVIYNTARKKYKLCKTTENKISLNKASKKYKLVMNTHIQNYRNSNEFKLRKLHSKQPKEYWKLLNKFKPKSKHKTPDLTELFNYFKEANTSNEETDGDYINNINLENNEFLDAPIIESEIETMIMKLNNGKACSNDFILNEYIKATRQVLMPIYIKLFNKVLDTGVLPEAWLEGMIRPIYKNKGDPLDPQNYRPITILSCLGKLFTSILNNRLKLFLEENNFLLENQAGFRANYSTLDHIFVLQYLIELLRSNKQKLYCCFIDFSKAFDKVWRVGLWNKLIEMGIKGKLFNIIFNMYQNIKSCVMINGDKSEFFSCENGLRQGENLSPILFSIFLNDLESYLRDKDNTGITLNNVGNQASFYLKILTLLYADDTILICNSEDALQKALNDFESYCKEWKLTINTDKTKVIVFGSIKLQKYKFKLGNKDIEVVKHYKYLGVFFSNNGSYLYARKHVLCQANKAMHLLLQRINNLDIPIDLQLKLFDSTILPILTYGSEIWGFENLAMIEKIHNDFLRKITKSRKSTPLYMLYAELGRYPIEITIKTRMIAFWNRLILSKETKYTSLCYQAMRFSETYEFKWLKHIKTILNETGNTYMWQDQEIIASNKLHILVKTTLIDQFKQNWYSTLQLSSKGKGYNLFKDNTNLEHFIKKLNRNDCLVLLKFRMSNTKLPIEVGRWKNSYLDIYDRKCTFCKSDLGDEFHYLFKCKHFKTKRIKLIPEYYREKPNIIKYKELMNSEDKYTLKNLCSFITHLLKEFE